MMQLTMFMAGLAVGLTITAFLSIYQSNKAFRKAKRDIMDIEKLLATRQKEMLQDLIRKTAELDEKILNKLQIALFDSKIDEFLK